MALVLVEHQDGHPDELSLQALALARGVTGEAPLEALLIGPGATDAANELGAHGVTTAHVTEDDRLGAYAPAAWARCVTEVADRTSPTAIVAAGSNRGNEVLAHVAARMDLPFAANCTKAAEDGTVTRVRWGGSLLEEARLKGSPLLLSCAPHAVQPATTNGAATPAVEPFEPELDRSGPDRPGQGARPSRNQGHLPCRGQGRDQRRPRGRLGRRLRHPRGARRPPERRRRLLARGDDGRLATRTPTRSARRARRSPPTSTSRAASAAPPSTSPAARARRRSSRSTPTPRPRS